MMYEVKPCPFCGKIASLAFLKRHETPGHYAVNCNARYGGCGAVGGWSRGYEGAANRWNARSHIQPHRINSEDAQEARE